MHPLESPRLAIKIPVADAAAVDLGALIPVFHRWIKDVAIADHVLIDVADYAHVPDGPGVMVIAHEAHYGIDMGDGAPGLLYARKRGLSGSPAERVAATAKAALRACALLEGDDALTLAFDTAKAEVRVIDRLAAPNVDATFAAVEGDLASGLEAAYGQAPALTYEQGDPREAFRVQARFTEAAPAATLTEG